MQNRQVASYTEASGAIQYNMTNNYMFRYILQENQNTAIYYPKNKTKMIH